MMQVVKKWRIRIFFDITNYNCYTIIISDNYYSNMLKKLGEVNFDREPIRIEIDEVKQDDNQNILTQYPTSTLTVERS